MWRVKSIHYFTILKFSVNIYAQEFKQCYNKIKKSSRQSLLQFSMIYLPYTNFIDSFYFYTFPHNPVYFNCDPLVNQFKTSSNIILVKNEFQTAANLPEPSKYLQNQVDGPASVGNELKQMNVSKKNLEKKERIQKQAPAKKKRRVCKPIKKVDMIQKEGRNSHSNILRKFFKLLSLQSQFTQVIDRIIKRNGFQLKASEYLSQMKRWNIDHRNYIRIKQIEHLFIQGQNATNTITRILFSHYLSSYYVEHLLSSKKTDFKSIIFHLKGRRTIRDQILLDNLEKFNLMDAQKRETKQ